MYRNQMSLYLQHPLNMYLNLVSIRIDVVPAHGM